MFYIYVFCAMQVCRWVTCVLHVCYRCILRQCKFCMGWLRLVNSLKLLVSFAKEPYKRDYILQKRPIILRSLLIVATPYMNAGCHTYAIGMLQIRLGHVTHMSTASVCPHTHAHKKTHVHTRAHTCVHTCTRVHMHTHTRVRTHARKHARTHAHTYTHTHARTTTAYLPWSKARCNTLQHIATLCSALQHFAAHCNALQHIATHCNTLQRTATHCNA